jgi:hypothetical protein
MTVRRSHVPEISRGRVTVTFSLVKTMGAPHWEIMPFSIVTRATVVFIQSRTGCRSGHQVTNQLNQSSPKAANKYSGVISAHVIVGWVASRPALSPMPPHANTRMYMPSRLLLLLRVRTLCLHIVVAVSCASAGDPCRNPGMLGSQHMFYGRSWSGTACSRLL